MPDSVARRRRSFIFPVDISKERPTVEQQKADDNSLYNEIKKLIKIRKSYKSLQSKGEVEFICAEKHKYPFAYIRSFENEKNSCYFQSLQ